MRNAGIKSITEQLIQSFSSEKKTTCAWLNHYSALQVMESGVDLKCCDFVGVDGQFLLMLMGMPLCFRTSADSVLPLLFDRLPPSRVGILGGTNTALAEFRTHFQLRWPEHELAFMKNGFDELPTSSELPDLLKTFQADIVIIGLGSPLQEQYLTQIAKLEFSSSPKIAFTCGGWIDQLPMGTYYPKWAYPLGLTWAVRLAREPRRLWRRYTLGASKAFNERRQLRSFVGQLITFGGHQ